MGEGDMKIRLKFNFQTYAKSLAKRYQILFGKIVQIVAILRILGPKENFN